MGETYEIAPQGPGAILHGIKKWLLIAAGTTCVCLGVAGIFLPLLPTTPFLLLAAACYAGSSKKFYHWLISNRWFGDYIKNYREGRGLTVKVKLLSVLSLWVTIGYSAGFVVQSFMVKVVLIAIAVAVTAHILSRPTFRKMQAG
ncbi:MAG: YbaN family protein [Methanocella sp.]